MTLVADERPVEIAADVAYTGVLRYVSKEGDIPIHWTKGVAVEEAAARDHFAKMRGHGYAAYRVTRDKRGKIVDRAQIHRFDPELGEIVMMTPSQGG